MRQNHRHNRHQDRVERMSPCGCNRESHDGGPQEYWLFEPAKPAPKTAPLIVFNHGWGAMDPRIYQAWINHIVERGNIVIYPLYQGSLLTPVKDFTPNAIAAVQDAIRTLKNEPGHVKPELDKFGIVGHSMGGPISANMAALWKTQGCRFRARSCVWNPEIHGKNQPGPPWNSPTFRESRRRRFCLR